MLITHVRIRAISNNGKRMVGVVSLTLDDMIVIHDVKILTGQDGLFLAMPSRIKKDGTFSDIVHPIKKEVRNSIEQVVFEGYHYMTENNISVLDLYPINNKKILTEQNYTDFEIRVNESENFGIE